MKYCGNISYSEDTFYCIDLGLFRQKNKSTATSNGIWFFTKIEIGLRIFFANQAVSLLYFFQLLNFFVQLSLCKKIQYKALFLNILDENIAFCVKDLWYFKCVVEFSLYALWLNFNGFSSIAMIASDCELGFSLHWLFIQL